MVSSKTLFVSAAVVAAASCVQDANAHTYITQPLTEFKKGASKSSWVAEFGPPWSGTFKTGAQYAAEAKKRGIKDLRSFLESKGPVCGNSLINAKAKAIPGDGTIKFASTLEHPGPCEIWLDNTRVFQNDDCEKKFGSATSTKINFSACKGKCTLRFYWLGLQDGGKRWQSYKNCIPLGGSRKLAEDEDEVTEDEDEVTEDEDEVTEDDLDNGVDEEPEVLGDDDSEVELGDVDAVYNGTTTETD